MGPRSDPLLGTLKARALFSAQEKAAFQAMYPELKPAPREDLVELTACVDFVERCLGRGWLWRPTRGTPELTQHLVHHVDGRFVVHPPNHPGLQLTVRGTKHDALVVKVFARFLKDLVTSESTEHAAERVDELRAMKFWAAFHELRGAVYFLRQGCEVSAPRPTCGPDGKVKKRPDWLVTSSQATKFAVECKHVDFVDGGWEPLGVKAVLRNVRTARAQIVASGLPGLIMIHVHPSRMLAQPEMRRVLQRVEKLLLGYPQVLGVLSFYDYFVDQGAGVRLGLLHNAKVDGVRNRSADQTIAKEVEGLVRTVPGPSKPSVLDD